MAIRLRDLDPAVFLNNVGIGTSNPTSAYWTSTKNITIADSVAAGLFIVNTTNGLEFNMAADTGGGVYFDVHKSTDATDNFFAFRTENSASSSSPTERLRITSGGNILMTNLPTSASGLPVGALWRDGTDVKVVV